MGISAERCVAGWTQSADSRHTDGHQVCSNDTVAWRLEEQVVINQARWLSAAWKPNIVLLDVLLDVLPIGLFTSSSSHG